MIRRLRMLVAIGGLLGLSLALAPGVAAGDPCYHGYTIPPPTTAETSTVKLEPCAFVPTTARVDSRHDGHVHERVPGEPPRHLARIRHGATETPSSPPEPRERSGSTSPGSTPTAARSTAG